MLTRARIEGFRCLRDVSVNFGPFNVLIGPNDSGKSTLLAALAAPRRASQGQVAAEAESIVLWSGKAQVKLSVVDGTVQSRPDKLERWFDATDPLRFDAERIAMPSGRGSGALAKLIANRGQGTAAHIAKVALGDRARYEAIQQGMRDVTQGRVQEIVVGEDTGSGYPMWFRLFDGTRVLASVVSAGLLLYLAFLCLIHRDDAPGILLIEEPENGLHPLRLHQVVGLLRTLTTQGVQVVLTTHSPDLLSACQPEEVIILRRPEKDSGTVVDRLPEDFDKLAMRSTLGEIWASRGEEGLLDILPRVEPHMRAP